MASNGDNDWPKWSKPALALAAMIFLGGIWIGVPLLSAFKLVDGNVQTSGVVDYRPMMSVLIAMTTATIAGIFLFMTLRIDRGTKRKAEEAARKEAKRAAKKAVKGVANEFRERLKKMEEASKQTCANMEKASEDNCAALVRETREKADEVFVEAEQRVAQEAQHLRGTFDEQASAKLVRETVQAKITEDALRGHVEAVLMLDVNVEILRKYVDEHAQELDGKAIERLAGVLKEVTSHLSQRLPEGREEEAGVFARVTRRFRK